ncbi:hypothetical protein DWX08_08510 [Ruminococcus sp. AF18-22]|jgi:hypothetical protein|nr:hypothetical protein DWX08_08510 [Ruminococcus sp. AF18-22]
MERRDPAGGTEPARSLLAWRSLFFEISFDGRKLWKVRRFCCEGVYCVERQRKKIKREYIAGL